jgi:hypothetical protein
MSEWTDDVEPEEQPRRNDVRRAVLGGVAGVTMLVAPIVLANAIVPKDDDDVQADDGTPDETSRVALRRQNLENARMVDEARLSSILVATTTTTTAPPTTTTTAPPTTTTTAPPTTTTTAAPVEPPPDSGSGQLGDPYYYPSWDALAECESGSNWQINTGNGYYGGLQFSARSWQSVGGTGLPHEHSRETQIAMAIRLWENGGWGHWPSCSSQLGYR